MQKSFFDHRYIHKGKRPQKDKCVERICILKENEL